MSQSNPENYSRERWVIGHLVVAERCAAEAIDNLRAVWPWHGDSLMPDDGLSVNTALELLTGAYAEIHGTGALVDERFASMLEEEDGSS